VPPGVARHGFGCGRQSPRLGGRRDLDHDVPEPVDLGRHAGRDDRRRVVLVDDRRTDAPVAGPECLSLVRAGGDLLQLAVDVEPGLGLVAQRVVGGLVAGLDLGRCERGHQPDATNPDVGHLDVGVLEPSRVLALVDVVEVAADALRPGVVDLAGGHVDAELVALAEVAAVGDPVDHDLVRRHAVVLEL
jgi:hypothetical protein